MAHSGTAVRDLPSALRRLDDLAGRRLAVFLDYDGTLAAVHADPTRVRLTPAMADTLARLSRRFPTAIVSGRKRPEVAERVGRPDMVVAGSHGFDIAGPGLEPYRAAAAGGFDGALDALTAAIADALAAIAGPIVERKEGAIAVHYRLVAAADVPAVEAAVERLAPLQANLRLVKGRGVYEIMPRLDWHKGRAIEWILNAWGGGHVPIYLGDDATDEDAFALLRDELGGHGVVVADDGEPARRSAAQWRLRDVDEVRHYLDALAKM